MPLCARCHIVKPPEEFYPYSPSWCKVCRRDYERGRRPHKRPQLPLGIKRCPDCTLDLPITAFRPRASGGVYAYCRPCELRRNEAGRKRLVKKRKTRGSRRTRHLRGARGPLGSQWAAWRTTRMRRCPDCGLDKPVATFRWDTKRDRPFGYCRPCSQERHKKFMRTPAGRATSRRYYASTPERKRKVTVRRLTSDAIKLGLLVRQPCEVCGAVEVEAHHDDYAQPLVVRWLCRKHHDAEHERVSP